MRTRLLGICMLFSAAVCAQRECATTQYLESQLALNPLFNNRLKETELFIESRTRAFRTNEPEVNAPGTIIKIPVVVHVVYNTAAQNISEAQVRSQVAVLTKDFRRLNADTNNTPARFRLVAADAGFEFVLATTDPMGRPTNGIVRKQTSVTKWKSDDKIKEAAQGGSAAWDSRYYLNIWVGNMESVIGYSSVPGGDADRDGIVLAFGAFGTINTSGSYNLGRTAVHEAGHWLGLKHIWGDTYCGTDMVDDTPQQGNFTPGCPTAFRSSCGNGATGDMYMNFMDYTSDACVNLFSVGQKKRMRLLFEPGGPRASLLNSKGLNQPWAEASPIEEPLIKIATNIYPNPVVNELTLNVDAGWVGQTVIVSNMQGVVVAKLVITSAKQKINVGNLPKGMYLLQAASQTKIIKEKFVKF